MRFSVFVEVLNWGKKKDGTNGAPIKIWERIDSRKNGQWLESEINIQKSLDNKDKKKRAVSFFQSKLKSKKFNKNIQNFFLIF